jgi:hypothetical protein
MMIIDKHAILFKIILKIILLNKDLLIANFIKTIKIERVNPVKINKRIKIDSQKLMSILA